MTQQERSCSTVRWEATLSLIGREIQTNYSLASDRRTASLYGVTAHSGTTPKMLSQQTRPGNIGNMISRELYRREAAKDYLFPDRIRQKHYSVLDVMCTWGTDYLNRLNVETPCQKQERDEWRERLIAFLC